MTPSTFLRRVAVLALALAGATACAGSDDTATSDAGGAATAAPSSAPSTTVSSSSTTVPASTVPVAPATTAAPSTTTPSTTTPSTTTPSTAAPEAATSPTTSTAEPQPAAGPTVVSGAYEFRDYELVVPSSYDGSEPVPLVLSLHGYTGSGPVQESYFRLGPLAQERGFLLVTPNGTFDPVGSRFWNATDACCNFGGAEVDDVGHLLGIVDEIRAEYEVDPLRIHLVGHSNGGFMSYRMACDHADVFASVVSLAGATFADAAACAPSEPVGVVQVHGTQDRVIRFEGGSTTEGPYPGAIATVSAWAVANGCGAAAAPTEPVLDLDDGRPGADSTITTFTGCPTGGAVELWTIVDGAHVPPLSDGFRTAVVDAVLANPKPPGPR